ncbi:hypothetical protein B0H19DRAFT_1072420 [Mycena capillaripes]|nr:hypothetical protein B0H19DRAFT_1072420 [Mycena capillaripes]
MGPSKEKILDIVLVRQPQDTDNGGKIGGSRGRHEKLRQIKINSQNIQDNSKIDSTIRSCQDMAIAGFLIIGKCRGSEVAKEQVGEPLLRNMEKGQRRIEREGGSGFPIEAVENRSQLTSWSVDAAEQISEDGDGSHLGRAHGTGRVRGECRAREKSVRIINPTHVAV